MRIAAAALGFLLAAAAGAQLVDSNELTYGPFVAGPRDHSFAIGVAPHGLLLAWSEVDAGEPYATIHVGRLDFNAQLVSPILTLAPTNPTSQATTPAIATDGHRFFVAWLERDVATWVPSRVAGTLVDPDGVQLIDTIHLGRATEGSPSLVWDGVTYRVFGHRTYLISPEGVVRKVHSGPTPQRIQFATPDANGWVDWKANRRSACWYGCPNAFFAWAVITRNWIRTGHFFEEGESSGKPAVLAKADDLLLIWSDNSGLKGLPIVDGYGAKRPFLLNHETSRSSRSPAAAESLVVYEKGGDIYGTVLIDGTSFGEPFLIVTGERWEELPGVYLLGPNRYLVTYVIGRDTGSLTLAGRFVTLP